MSVSPTMAPVPWEALRTAESRQIEDCLRQAFQQADAYRYNSASIRVRVIDPSFVGRSLDERDALIDVHLRRLPESIQADIIMLLAFSPDEIQAGGDSLRAQLLNLEFNDPPRSTL